MAIDEKINDTTIIPVRNVPVELRNKFKAKCAMEGISMGDKLIQMLEEEVGKE